MGADLIQELFVRTEKNKFRAQIRLDGDFDFTGHSIRQVLYPDLNAPVVGDAENPCAEIFCGIQGRTVLTAAAATGIQWWSPACPALYRLSTEVISTDGSTAFFREDRIAFRDVESRGDELFLNGLRLDAKQSRQIQMLPAGGDINLVERCNTEGRLIVIEIDGDADEKHTESLVKGLRNSPAVIAWSVSKKSTARRCRALLDRIDGSRPVLCEFKP